MNRRLAAATCAALTVAACGIGAPSRVTVHDGARWEIGNDSGRYAQIGQQWTSVLPVPIFSQSVHITSVTVEMVAGPPLTLGSVRMLQLPPSSPYSGAGLNPPGVPPSLITQGGALVNLSSVDIASGKHPDLRIIVPISINEHGCHEARWVIHYRTRDRRARVFKPRWFVVLTDVRPTNIPYGECGIPVPERVLDSPPS